MDKPTEQETLATTLPGLPWEGWYCTRHPDGEAIANARERAHCWGCGAARPPFPVTDEKNGGTPMPRGMQN
jgi:hypothetical protein